MAAHSIELLFDDDTDAAIRRDWTALAEAGLPSQAQHRSPSNRPHVTLTVAQRIDAAVDGDLVATARGLPIACRIGAPIVFGRRALTLARLVVPSAALVDVHALVFDCAAAHQTPAPFDHSRPGEWTPHVTLCRRLASVDLPAALAAIGPDDVVGEFTLLRRWDGDARVDRVIATG